MTDFKRTQLEMWESEQGELRSEKPKAIKSVADVEAYFDAELARLGNLTDAAWNDALVAAQTDAGFTLDDEGHMRALAESVVIDHGLVDEKGRKVGGFVLILARVDAQEVLIPHPLGGGYRARRAVVGFKFAGYRTHVRATRDGAPFGAWPTGKKHATLEAARAAAPKLLAAQGKRYAKKFGGAV